MNFSRRIKARGATISFVNTFIFRRGSHVALSLFFAASATQIASAQPVLEPLKTAAPIPTATIALAPDVPSARAPIAQHIEGTVSVQSFSRAQVADVKFSAPDSLFVHIQPNAAQNTPDEIYIARGARQTTYNAASRRVRRWNWSSAQQPWRSAALADGGAANIALWGWNPQAAARFYTLTATKNGAVTTVTMTAKPNARRAIYDSQRSGGRGDRVLFAVLKRTVYDWPRVVVLQFDNENRIVSQERRDERNRVLDKSIIVWNGDFPVTATTRDANNVVVATWKYDLRAAAAHDATIFDLSAATKNASKNQIVEDAELQPIAVYAKQINTATGTARAAALFHLGAAQRVQSEDILGARANLENAAKLQPQAVAPVLQSVDLALQTRDIARATTALKSLETLVGADDVLALERREQLAFLQRNWNGAQAALRAQVEANPNSSSTRLSLARLQLLRGDIARARQLLEEILALESSDKSTSGASLFTTPQSFAQASAAILWANSFRSDETAALIPIRTDAQRLARAILEMRNPNAQNAQSAAFVTRDASFLEALARSQGENGKTEEAIASWTTLAARGNLSSSTRAHRALMTLHAKSGDLAQSLRSFWVVLRRDEDEDARSQTRRLLLEAWRRNLRGDQLRRSLELRSVANDSTEDEARLWLAWQENYAAPDAVAATVRNFAAKYRQNAWWQSRLADQLIAEAEPLKKDPQGRGIRLTQEALTAVERAISLDKSQSYYAIQRAFILTFRANDLRKAAISDAGATINAVDAAQSALDDLRKNRATDSEVAISVAAAQQALSTKDNNAIADFKRGLEGGLPGRSSASGERHNTAFAARQALAIALRRQKRWFEAAAQYDNLMTGANSAEEQVGIASNYLVLARLSSGGNADALAVSAAQLLKRLSSEAWSLDAADAATRSFATAIQNSDFKVWSAVINVLRREKGENSQLALSYLLFSLQNGLSAMQSSPDADVNYIRGHLKQIAPYVVAAEESLENVANSDNAIVAARAHVLLADRNLLRLEYSNAQAHLRSALALEPENINLRLAQARAFGAADEPDEALQLLADLQQRLPLDATTLNNLAKVVAQIGNDAPSRNNAHELLERAWRLAQLDSGTSSQEAQRIAYLLARARIAKGQIAQAATIYNGLADASWTRLARAAAFLDWETQLRVAQKTTDADAIKKRRDALALTPIELQNVRTFLNAL